jgi:hypothetical protein
MATQSLSSQATEGNGPTPKQIAHDAWWSLLQAQALILVLQAALDNKPEEEGALDFGVETLLEIIHEKLRVPMLFCDTEHCKRWQS